VLVVTVMRSVLLAGAQNRWLRERATRYWFVRRTASRFMPGETMDDALSASAALQSGGIATILTHLGENVSDSAEAAEVTNHYLALLDRLRAMNSPTTVSVKLTQLGLDLGKKLCYANLDKLIGRAGSTRMFWIDMESSNYVDATLELYRQARLAYPNVGVCLQACLHRTNRDLAELMPLGPAIRLVKGAYKEPPDRAFEHKTQVDENFLILAKLLLSEEARSTGVQAAIGTHDITLIRQIKEFALSHGRTKNSFEFQMLYGIQRGEQGRLVNEGWRCTVLINYGEFWFPWFMRRLAERPANVLFLLRNLFVK
jgi:proline dehydrogenase